MIETYSCFWLFTYSFSLRDTLKKTLLEPPQLFRRLSFASLLGFVSTPIVSTSRRLQVAARSSPLLCVTRRLSTAALEKMAS